MNALTGKGLQVDKQSSRRSVNVHVPKNKNGGLILPQNWRSPPFYGSWPQSNGMGLKKKKKHSIISFVNKPLSNLDLLNWVKKLGIKHFRGIYSKDVLPDRIKRNEVGIINLDSQIGPGTHWVAYRNNKNGSEYFDSFGLIMPNEVMKYLMISGKQIFYSGDEIQERDSVLCGYWCLYYLLERQKGVPILNVIHNTKFDINNQTVNHHFIIDYFKII